MKFKKYVSAGNDFFIFDGNEFDVEDPGKFAKKICDRHFGVGADGIMIAEESSIADIKMVYYNSDGTEGEMCGNGIMSFIKFTYENGLINKGRIKVETKAGVKLIQMEASNGKTRRVRVNMGSPIFAGKDIPVDIDAGQIIGENIEIDDYEYLFSAVNMGVPHVVIFVEKVTDAQINYLGDKIENHSLFPEKTNVNFVNVIDEYEIEIFTWERGAGRTLGCGTGSAAAVVIGSEMGKLGNMIKVNTEGGVLRVDLVDGQVFLTGQPLYVAEGVFDYKD